MMYKMQDTATVFNRKHFGISCLTVTPKRICIMSYEPRKSTELQI